MARQLTWHLLLAGPVDPAVLDGDPASARQRGTPCGCRSRRGRAPGASPFSSHFVHFGPAAVPSAMQSPEAGGVAGGEPGTAPAAVVGGDAAVGQLAHRDQPLDRVGAGRAVSVELVGSGVVAVPDDQGERRRSLAVARRLPGLGGAAQVVGDDPGLDHRGGGAGLVHVRRADDLAGAPVQHAPGVPALEVEVEVVGLERQRLAGPWRWEPGRCRRCGRGRAGRTGSLVGLRRAASRSTPAASRAADAGIAATRPTRSTSSGAPSAEPIAPRPAPRRRAIRVSRPAAAAP